MDGVVAGAAEDEIVLRATIEIVVAEALDRVALQAGRTAIGRVGRVAEDGVVALAAIDGVAVEVAIEDVVAVVAVDRIDAEIARQRIRGEPAIHDVVALGAFDYIRSGVDHDARRERARRPLVETIRHR